MVELNAAAKRDDVDAISWRSGRSRCSVLLKGPRALRIERVIGKIALHYNSHLSAAAAAAQKMYRISYHLHYAAAGQTNRRV